MAAKMTRQKFTDVTNLQNNPASNSRDQVQTNYELNYSVKKKRVNIYKSNLNIL